MSGSKSHYVFQRGTRGIFAEIYFPRKAVHQGPIFKALREGHNEKVVKKYFRDNISSLLIELEGFSKLFDPRRFEDDTPEKNQRKDTKKKEALRRIELYKSPFAGWSLYQVDGVFFDKKGKEYEEAAQVVRIIFRFKSSLRGVATRTKCNDVLRAIVYWVISMRGHLVENNPWDDEECKCFIAHHEPWSKKKLRFVHKYFLKIAKECTQWIDNCALFIFGYLVRQFSANVLKERRFEDEIWVTSFFDLTINVIKRE